MLQGEGLQMKTIMRIIGSAMAALSVIIAMACLSWAEEGQPVEVGRVYYMEGNLLRYVPDDNDWVAVVKDAPVGVEDTFFSGDKGRAELIVPNGSWVRVGNNTQIQVIALDSDTAEMDVATGVVRFYNKGSDTVIKATSPFGYVLADPGTVFDFYVGDNSVEVVAVKGTVSFVQSSTDAKYDVAEGSPSILADKDQVSSGEGTVDSAWDDWNDTRENYWSAKSDKRGSSANYLPPSLAYDADALDENGEWEMLPYEGRDCWFWRPTTVIVGWSPFTMGVWTDWYGDQIWIPGEPFGYVTHHYGNWVYLRHHWCWAPPVARVLVGLPLLDISFSWNPGRVSWIHRGDYVGWVPLAPRETYYSHRNWGGSNHREVNHDNITRININIRNYSYANHAIIVRQNNFYGVRNYGDVREKNTSTTVINNYQAAPVINNTVINNYTTNKQRYNYTNVMVTEKPHNTVVNRIKENETTIRQGKKENAAVLKQQVKNTPEGKINRDVRVEAPKATNYIVPSNEVNRPKSEIKLQQKEIKTKAGAPRGVSPGGAGRTEQQPGQSGQPVAQPGRNMTPSQPGQMEKPAVQPGRTIVPSTPSKQEAPVTQPGRTVAPSAPGKQETPTRQQPNRTITPSTPGQQEKPAVQPDRVIVPSMPGRQESPSTQQQPNRTITPSTPGQQEKPAVQPGRVIVPSMPGRQESPSTQQQPNRTITPSTPGQQEKPALQPGRVIMPSKPAQPETPAVQPNRVITPTQPSQPQTPAMQPNRVNTPSKPVEKGKQEKAKTRESTDKQDQETQK
jgi:hypothetical protein